MSENSNLIIKILNVVFFVVAVVFIGLSIWIGANNADLCNIKFGKALLCVGLFLLVVSLVGLVGSCNRFSFFLWIYLTLIFFLIALMVAHTTFSIMVTNREAGNSVSNKNYSNWLENHVFNGKHWDDIKTCVVKVETCQKLDKDANKKVEDDALRPVKIRARHQRKTNLYRTFHSFCCKPPTNCEFQNATMSSMPKQGSDSDCNTWSNDQTKLCFECKSCKASMINTIKEEWVRFFVINVVILVLTIIVFAIGCSALKNKCKTKERPLRYA